ncbi:MAG: hypothetical protein KJO57_15645 [Deltaproteobacteria bacterium]|nr:hypothetical protein [Deltaproteobacteria bacterium]
MPSNSKSTMGLATLVLAASGLCLAGCSSDSGDPASNADFLLGDCIDESSGYTDCAEYCQTRADMTCWEGGPLGLSGFPDLPEDDDCAVTFSGEQAFSSWMAFESEEACVDKDPARTLGASCDDYPFDEESFNGPLTHIRCCCYL